MAGFNLIPIAVAVPLIMLIVALMPAIPVAWIGIALTRTAQGICRGEGPCAMTRSVGRYIALSAVLPCVAVMILCLMVIAQLVLAPLTLYRHLRNLYETILWLSLRLGLAPYLTNTASPPLPDTTAVTIQDVRSLPRYTFTPLPPTHIRLLCIHPGTFDSPIRGTITATPLSSAPKYDALSYAETTPATLEEAAANPSTKAKRAETILLLCHEPSSPTNSRWTVLPLTSDCAAALRRVRLQAEGGTKTRRVWLDAVCVNQDDPVEKSVQVGMRDRILCTARRVVVCTGEGGGGMDEVLEWVNSLPPGQLRGQREGHGKLMTVRGGDLDSPSERQGHDERMVEGMRKGVVASLLEWNAWERVEQLAAELAQAWRRYGGEVWRLAEERYLVAVAALGLVPAALAALRPAPENLHAVLEVYFSRGWFRRVWSLQEVAPPELSRIRFICGTRETTSERMLHLMTLLKDAPGTKNSDTAKAVELFLQLRANASARRPDLLDLLIQTRDWHCEEPRDKVFGILSIARRLHVVNSPSADPQPKVDYRVSVSAVYAAYSAQFIRWHGPGFFLALIKSPQKVSGLPSWAADWTVPWPNMRALAGVDFAARSRVANEKDCVLDFDIDEAAERTVMKIMRPRIVRGFFTRDGHLDGTGRTRIENVRQLNRDEDLVEMYPGLALLLKREKGDSEKYTFIRACPHALSRDSLERIVASWSRVVSFQEEIGRQDNDGSASKAYLSLPRVYEII
ncbi:hypothetical protein C8A03DRAFT_18431 [Achaetomium macrosporum]|uniref:Heterokaryon incompatibility domain-containing protein n=1 Tax=Achaetomium macrosporum TaxID=79813 RepID=A0AAN7C4R4_9PEZI|nr:hypothetical protein C8A03DRAFT_18431 [Achaetomium macrosporum]